MGYIIESISHWQHRTIYKHMCMYPNKTCMIKYYIRKFSFPNVYGISNRSDEENVATDTFTHANCATLYSLYAAPYIIQVSQVHSQNTAYSLEILSMSNNLSKDHELRYHKLDQAYLVKAIDL